MESVLPIGIISGSTVDLESIQGEWTETNRDVENLRLQTVTALDTAISELEQVKVTGGTITPGSDGAQKPLSRRQINKRIRSLKKLQKKLKSHPTGELKKTQKKWEAITASKAALDKISGLQFSAADGDGSAGVAKSKIDNDVENLSQGYADIQTSLSSVVTRLTAARDTMKRAQSQLPTDRKISRLMHRLTRHLPSTASSPRDVRQAMENLEKLAPRYNGKLTEAARMLQTRQGALQARSDTTRSSINRNTDTIRGKITELREQVPAETMQQTEEHAELMTSKIAHEEQELANLNSLLAVMRKGTRSERTQALSDRIPGLRKQQAAEMEALEAITAEIDAIETAELKEAITAQKEAERALYQYMDEHPGDKNGAMPLSNEHDRLRSQKLQLERRLDPDKRLTGLRLEREAQKAKVEGYDQVVDDMRKYANLVTQGKTKEVVRHLKKMIPTHKTRISEFSTGLPKINQELEDMRAVRRLADDLERALSWADSPAAAPPEWALEDLAPWLDAQERQVGLIENALERAQIAT